MKAVKAVWIILLIGANEYVLGRRQTNLSIAFSYTGKDVLHRLVGWFIACLHHNTYFTVLVVGQPSESSDLDYGIA